jgi:hypothetical protein
MPPDTGDFMFASEIAKKTVTEGWFPRYPLVPYFKLMDSVKMERLSVNDSMLVPGFFQSIGPFLTAPGEAHVPYTVHIGEGMCHCPCRGLPKKADRQGRKFTRR